MLNFFEKNSFILSGDDSKAFILLWRYKKYKFINISLFETKEINF